jgi:hypothetical protein
MDADVLGDRLEASVDRQRLLFFGRSLRPSFSSIAAVTKYMSATS